MSVLQLALVTSWLPGNGTVCAFHGRAPERQCSAGERMCELQVSDMDITDDALPKVLIIIMTNAGITKAPLSEQRVICYL